MANDVSPGLPIGYELGYTQITSTVNVASTNSAAPTTIITASAITFDGGPVICEFWALEVDTPANAVDSSVFIDLYESTTFVQNLAKAETFNVSATRACSVVGRIRFTPSVGSHTYIVAAYVQSTTGTPAIRAGSGAVGGFPPAYVRFTKV